MTFMDQSNDDGIQNKDHDTTRPTAMRHDKKNNFLDGLESISWAAASAAFVMPSPLAHGSNERMQERPSRVFPSRYLP
jgi:hypothetical protein